MSIKKVSRQLAELTSQLTSRFDGIDARFDGIDVRLGRMESKVETLGTKVDEGFDSSRARDEELRSLINFGFEAREALRESVESHFDEAARKHNQQIGLLTDVVRHLSSHK